MAKGKSITTHPERHIIDKMLLTGWSTTKVSDWLEYSGKPMVSSLTLRNYRENYLEPKPILSESAYEKIIKRVDVHIDSLQELYNLIEILKRRLGPAIEEEMIHKTLTPEVREDLKLLKETLIKTLQLEMELCIRDRRPIEISETKLDITALLLEFASKEKEMEALQEAIEP